MRVLSEQNLAVHRHINFTFVPLTVRIQSAKRSQKINYIAKTQTQIEIVIAQP